MYQLFLALILCLSLHPARQRAVVYLANEYDPGVGLLRESPITAPDRYWLATDNRLAIYALKAAGQAGLADRIGSSVEREGDGAHGVIEALTGQDIGWPPRTETQTQVSGNIWNEERLSGVVYADWAEYADLALYGALDAHNEGDNEEALRRYRLALQMFDGVGFADKAYLAPDGHGRYATYKLALAIFVAAAIGEAPDVRLLPALLAKQDEVSGGFVALYDDTGTPVGDMNTETTSYALLALVGEGKGKR